MDDVFGPFSAKPSQDNAICKTFDSGLCEQLLTYLFESFQEHSFAKTYDPPILQLQP